MQLALRPRLAAVAELVVPGEPLLDVGTDHGRLPAELVRAGRIPAAIASDLRPAPLAVAGATIARLGLAGRVALRCADGLRAIDPGEVTTITVAGMGGETIAAILAAEPARRLSARRLVLQPEFGAAPLRRWLAAHGHVVVDERLVLDRGRFYAVIAAERGLAPDCSPAEWEFGPVLLRRGGALVRRQLERELRLCEVEAAGLGRAAAPDPARVARAAARRELIAAALAELSRPRHPGPGA